MEAFLRGTINNPWLLLRFGWKETHARTRKDMQAWVKTLPGRKFDKALGGWVVTGVGPNPQKMITDAGFEILWMNDPTSDLQKVRNLDDLVTPVTRLAPNRRRTLVRHRLLGFEKVQEMLGWGAIWDAKKGLFTVPTMDLILKDGTVRPGFHHDPAAVTEAIRLRTLAPYPPEHAALLAKAGNAPSMDALTSEEIATLRSINGVLPAWFGLPLFPFQEIGALAAAAGHSGLFDAPRVGKALPVSEPVLTPNGFVRMGDLRVGSKVVGSDGKPTTVTGVFPQGERPIFKVGFSDGVTVFADSDHLWQVQGSGTRIMTTTELLATGLKDDTAGGAPWSVPVVEPVRFTIGHAAGLIDERVALIRKEMATKGLLAASGHSWFVANSEAEAAEFITIIRSLGGVTVPTGDVTTEVEFVTTFNPFSDELSPEAAAEWDQHGLHTPERHITSISYSHQEDAQCIEVDAADHLFVMRDFVVTHNTRTSLAAAAHLKSHRTLIITPPLVMTNWAFNVEESRLHNRGGKTDGKIVIFKAGRKEPELPETGVVIISDSLVAARPELKDRIAAWRPQVTIVDEAHREGTYGTKRAEAVLDLAAATEKRTIPLTGTPIFSSPNELTPLLEMSGHLAPIFGGVDPFLQLFTTRDKWGRNHASKKRLPELQQMLRDHVWVRRTKEQVGIGMPGTHEKLILDVDLKLFRDAHEEVNEKIDEWVDAYVADNGAIPGPEAIKDFANDNLGLLSILRRAAGMSKIPGATELIGEHVKATVEYLPDGRPIYNRPLIIWTIHRDVTEAMQAALGDKIEGSAMIIGGMSQNQKDDVVRRFQAGEIPVLAASIIAAGVGIDLTRSSDAWFVETDWTPANVQQAMDRIQGVNQKKNPSILTMIAYGTLDERIQKVQNAKGKTLNAVLGGDHDVSVVDDIDEMKSAGDIVIALTEECIARRSKKRR